ncbi:MAG: polysulfide reductase [Ignavibacteriae bacterium]|nr:MAG: polysulfide reductase [Ignavibacteriota bacterium]
MQELTSTRHNLMIDPNIHIWGWEIPVYLFLGGLVAGMMIISGYLLYKDKYKEPDSSIGLLPLFGIILLSLGMFTLFLDLEHKLYVWRMYMTFRIKSPMSWGSWILILVYPALIANLLIKPPLFLTKRFPKIMYYSSIIRGNQKIVKTISIANISLGIGLGIYTGILLSAFSARPLWNSAVLPLLFLISGLSTASALVHMISKNKHERVLFAKADNVFIGAELFIILLFIIGMLSSAQANIDAIYLILNGPYAAVFWIFVVLLGLVIPLFIQSLSVLNKISHTAVAPILVLAGGLLLRFVIVNAGQFSHWNLSSFIK